MDHDQRFKVLIQEFFGEFMALFFAEWLEQEIFLDPPHGRRRVADLVAKLPLRQPAAANQVEVDGFWLAIVHIEIEQRDSVVPLRATMFELYQRLRQRHRHRYCPWEADRAAAIIQSGSIDKLAGDSLQSRDSTTATRHEFIPCLNFRAIVCMPISTTH